MFDFKSYGKMMVLEETLLAALNNEKQTVIPADLMRRLYHLRETFQAEVKKAADMIVREARFGIAVIKMPTPMTMKAADETGQEFPVEISEYSREIHLPVETERYYAAVLFIEAEALLRDWCEICIENHKVAS